MKSKIMNALRISVAALFMSASLLAPVSRVAAESNNNNGPQSVTCPDGVGISVQGNACKVTICHRTDSVTNPYTNPTVDMSSVDGNAGNDNGQGDHLLEHTGPVFQVGFTHDDTWGDIIPPLPGVTTGLNWTAEGQAIWNNGCNLPTQATPAPVTFHDACGYADDTYTIPTTTGVNYQVNGITKAAGTYHGSGTVTVTAVAQNGYTLSGTTTWSHTFTDEDCTVQITPEQPQPTPPTCEDQEYVFNFTTPQHYHYEYNGQTLVSGTAFDADGSTITITAVADNGYTFGYATSSWDYTLTPAEGCGGEENTPVTPAPVTFTDVCGTANDTFTIPSTPGVDYYVNDDNSPTAAGTYSATGTVTVTAVAQDGFVLTDSTSQWSHDFSDESCPVTDVCPNIDGVQATLPANMVKNSLGNCLVIPQVLGDSTNTPSTPAVNAAQLVNTGSSVLLNLFAGMFVLGLATIITIASRKNPVQAAKSNTSISA